MCGLYGVFGPGINKEDLSVVGLLGFLNMQRGIHSTGVAQVWYDKGRKPKITKDTVPAMYFFNKEENKTLLTDATVYALMCHNRYATVGNSGNVDGAHPFETERYVGFHNGTLREEKYADHEHFLTDSEALWNDITQKGMEEVLTPLYEDSAFALAYYDKEKHTIGFVRNGKRPLAFACHPTRNVVYYSSDINDLRYALNKANITAHFYTLAEWHHIYTDPRKMNFKDIEGDRKLRTNLWFIDQYTPKPEKPPVRKTEYVYSSTSNSTTWRGNFNNSGTCRICNDKLLTKKSVSVLGFGRICDDCDGILYMNHSVDTKDEVECHAVTYFCEEVREERRLQKKQESGNKGRPNLVVVH